MQSSNSISYHEAHRKEFKASVSRRYFQVLGVTPRPLRTSSDNHSLSPTDLLTRSWQEEGNDIAI